MSKEPSLSILLGAVVQELAAPLATAYMAAERARLRLERAQASLGQLSRNLDALRWLSQALESPDAAQQNRSPAVMTRSLATVAQLGDNIRADFPAGLTVMAGHGVLDAVLGALLMHARQHQSKRSTIQVIGRTLQNRSECPSALALSISGPLVWLTVEVDSATAFAPSLFDPETHIGLWLSRELLRHHGCDLWCERTARGAAFHSLWPSAPFIAPDGWPDGRTEFGRAVREAREKHHLTRARLSHLCGLADSTIRNIETGRHGYTQNSRERLLAGFAKLKQP